MELATWTVRDEPDACVLEVRGEIDMQNAAAFGTAGAQLASTMPLSTRLVIDLSAVEYIGSSGLRALLRIQQRATCTRVLRRPSRTVRRLLDVAVPGVFTCE